MQQMQEAQAQSLTDQAGQLASAPMMDPSKNPELNDSQEAEANTEGTGTDGPQGGATTNGEA